MTNILAFGAIAGSLLGALLITYIGRRFSIMGTGVTMFIGWILSGSASNPYILIAGQGLCGISIGVLSVACPVYIIEIAHPKIRGALGLLPMAFLYSGITLAQFLGAYLDWSKMAYLGAGISVPFFFLMFAVPESPRWYIAKGRIHNARIALEWFRGSDVNIDDELQNLRQFQITADKTKGCAFGQMFYMENIPAVFIPLALMILQTFDGSFVMYYLSHTMSDDINKAYNFTNIVGVITIVGASVAIILVDRIGRKILLYISSACMIVSFVVLCMCLYFLDPKASTFADVLLKACILLHAFGMTMGYRSLSWLILGEMLPLRIRGIAASITTGITWACNFYIGFNFGNVLRDNDVYKVILLYISINIVQVFYVVMCVPETCGKSLEEIEVNLTQRVKNIKYRNEDVVATDNLL